VPSRVIAKGTIFSHTGIDPYSRSAEHNFNHAPNIIQITGEKHIVAWFSGPWEGHPWQCILCAYSHNDGYEWSTAEILQNTEKISDFDPAFIRKGKRIYLFYSLARWWEPKLVGEKKGFLGNFIKYTDDMGKTWSDARKLSDRFAQRSNGIVLVNGDLLLSCYTQDGHFVVLKSIDDGNSWQIFGDLNGPVRLTEPTIVELSGGKILMMMRSTDGFIWASRSENFGATWLMPYKTDVKASNASHVLYRMKDGRIALAYNSCKPHKRSPLILCLSEDEGVSWETPVLLDEIEWPNTDHRAVHPSGADHAVTYPSIGEDSIGNLIVVWSRYRISANGHWGDIHFAKISF